MHPRLSIPPGAFHYGALSEEPCHLGSPVIAGLKAVLHSPGEVSLPERLERGEGRPSLAGYRLTELRESLVGALLREED